jgi:hypothetical protein
LTLAGSLAATTAPPIAPPPALPSPSLIPSRVGASISFHYDANENGPNGAGGTHAVVTLTRIVNDRLAVTISPDEGQATAVVARVQSDGSLRVDRADARRSPAASGNERGGDPNLPMDGPIGGLPGGAGGGGQGQDQGRGQYGQGQYGGARVAARVEIPAALRILSALVAARSSASGSWPFAVALGSGEPGVAMIAKLEKTVGSEATVVADGTGEIRIATAAPPGSSPQSGTGGYGRGRSRGQGQGIPGQGQGIPGQGQGVPGQGGSGRGGPGQGGYGQGGYGQGGNAAPQAPQTVPATATLHVESTFRGGRVHVARGSETMVVHGGSASGDTTTSVRWTLTAL